MNKPKKCYNCGGDFPHVREKPCPALGKQCSNCGKPNHLATCCRTKSYKINNIASLETDENFNVAWAMDSKSSPFMTTRLEICKSLITFKIDTAASCNVMDEKTWETLSQKPILSRTNIKLFAYGMDKPMNLLGEFKARVTIDGKYKSIIIVVTKGGNGNLLGLKTVTEIGLVKFINEVKEHDPYLEKLKKQYPSLFTGKIGKLNGNPVCLTINKNIKPVRQRARAASFHLREGIEKTIQKMLDNDIIERVEGATPWVSPIVPVVKENGDVRVCVDARRLNTAVEREAFNQPTVDEVAIDISEAKHISKFDFGFGYNQIVLDESSRYITVFITHCGTFRFKRLCFGVNCASEIFQKRVQEVLQGIRNCKNLSDDVIVWVEHKKSMTIFFMKSCSVWSKQD